MLPNDNRVWDNANNEDSFNDGLVHFKCLKGKHSSTQSTDKESSSTHDTSVDKDGQQHDFSLKECNDISDNNPTTGSESKIMQIGTNGIPVYSYHVPESTSDPFESALDIHLVKTIQNTSIGDNTVISRSNGKNVQTILASEPIFSPNNCGMDGFQSNIKKEKNPHKKKFHIPCGSQSRKQDPSDNLLQDFSSADVGYTMPLPREKITPLEQPQKVIATERVNETPPVIKLNTSDKKQYEASREKSKSVGSEEGTSEANKEIAGEQNNPQSTSSSSQQNTETARSIAIFVSSFLIAVICRRLILLLF